MNLRLDRQLLFFEEDNTRPSPRASRHYTLDDPLASEELMRPLVPPGSWWIFPLPELVLVKNAQKKSETAF